MDDAEALQLRATIVPTQSGWPEPKVVHWIKLHSCADEARERVAQAWATMTEIDRSVDLSSEGKARRKKKIALEALAEFEKSKTLALAKEAAERQLSVWAERAGLAIKAPINFPEAMVAAEIRAHLASMKDQRLGFLEKYATDPVVAGAVLGAPGFLSGLSENEVTFVRKRVEKHVAPEIAAARDDVLKAMKDAEHGWQRAMDKIGERAGLTKGPDGSWRDPMVSEPAAA